MATRAHASLAIGLASAFGCRPNLGAAASSIDGPRILAVRGTPPEVTPAGKVPGVLYDLLAVGPDGSLPPANNVWSYCTAAHPPSDNNVVNVACLGSDQIQAVGPNGPTTFGAIPPHDCSLYGPIAPMATPDAAAARPPDPDLTGGYYQPVRVELPLADGSTLVAFGEERIGCGAGAVSLAEAVTYSKTYKPNRNPVLGGLSAVIGTATTQPLNAPDGGPPVTLPPGTAVNLIATWPAASAEIFPALDPVTLLLNSKVELLIASFFATGGTIAVDEISVAADAGTTAIDQWTTPTTPGPVHLWVVLRDDRGGVTWGEYLVLIGG